MTTTEAVRLAKRAWLEQQETRRLLFLKYLVWTRRVCEWPGRWAQPR